jgi:hypothetical protein
MQIIQIGKVKLQGYGAFLAHLNELVGKAGAA